jgi:Fur family iron response transcriptional regulator
MKKLRPYSEIIESLRGAGLRPTRQRLALTKLLFDGKNRHVTAEILHGEALRAGISVSLATVYNSLNQLNKAGLLREIVVEVGRSYFDTNISPHHHIFNEDTRELTDIAANQIHLTGLPEIADGQKINRIDVILRVNNSF